MPGLRFLEKSEECSHFPFRQSNNDTLSTLTTKGSPDHYIEPLPPLPEVPLAELHPQSDTKLNTSHEEKKRKYRKLDKIDLSDVPAQPLILKNCLPRDYVDNSRRRPVKKGKSSKYLGVYFDSKLKKWKAQMMMEGNVRSLGYYISEEDAAAVYAKAAFKYKTKKASETYGGYNLSDVPPQPLIRKENCASGFRGVHKNKERWEARIKGTALGTFDTPEEAAGIYARALHYLNRERLNNDNLDGEANDSSSDVSVANQGAPACQNQARSDLLAYQSLGDVQNREDLEMPALPSQPNQYLPSLQFPNQGLISSVENAQPELEAPIGTTSIFQDRPGLLELPAEEVDLPIFEV